MLPPKSFGFCFYFSIRPSVQVFNSLALKTERLLILYTWPRPFLLSFYLRASRARYVRVVVQTSRSTSSGAHAGGFSLNIDCSQLAFSFRRRRHPSKTRKRWSASGDIFSHGATNNVWIIRYGLYPVAANLSPLFSHCEQTRSPIKLSVPRQDLCVQGVVARRGVWKRRTDPCSFRNKTKTFPPHREAKCTNNDDGGDGGGGRASSRRGWN